MATEQEQGEVAELLPEDLPEADVEETDDGGAIISEGPEVPAIDEESEFYRNLLEDPAVDLNGIRMMTLDLIERIEQDKRSREEYDKTYAEGIKRTGVGNEAPGGASFLGASRAVHPMLSKAAIDFEARAIAELMPAQGPVKDFIPGEPTQARVDKARRKVAYMNWQLKVQVPEFRAELERLLTQCPLGGSQFMFWAWDHRRKRPTCAYWASDQVWFPYGAASIYTAERLTMAETISDFEFDRRVASGEYFVPEGVVLTSPSQGAERTEAKKATDKAQGQDDPQINQDGNRMMLRTFCYLEIEDDPEREGEKLSLPYTVVIDNSNHQCVSIVRNWEQDDEAKEPMVWLVEVPFLPWRGPLSLGLVQFIGSLAGTATGSIRALLDSAHINNLPTLLKLKGANFVGQSQQVDATQITELEGGVSGDMDIRKLVMAIPFNPPSLVLLQLLGLVTQEGEGFVRTSLDKLGEQRADMPVGTTLALIEQGLKTLSGIHGRLYDAMNRMLMVLHRLNRMYVTDEEIRDDTGELLARRSDFQGPMDVVPVSDPEIFSDVQRFAQMQLVAQRAQLLPQLYDLRKVEEMILERTKIPDAKSLLLPEMKPQEMNQVNENAAMAMGRPVIAFPEQDHLAHIQVLLDFLTNPFFGMSPLIGRKFIPAALQHLNEHMVLWYVNEFYEAVNAELDEDAPDLGELMKDRSPKVRQEVDRLLAEASDEVMELSSRLFARLPPVIAAAQQFLQSLAPELPPDPQLEKQKLIEQGKERADQAAAARELGKQQNENMRTQLREQGENQRTAAKIASDQKINSDDNLTALGIARAEIEGSERVGVSTGDGINPG